MSPRAVLALGSGGARGYAHIGVIEEVESRGYEIAAISGCSMGAVIGGIYAAGHLDDYRDWVCRLGYLDVLRLVDLTWSGAGTMRAGRVMGHLGKWLEGIDIESLPIPFTSVATDLVRQREVWFQRGSLMRAIRASIAIPGVITPVSIDDRLLVDGGLVNPLPILPTLSVRNDLVIAVNVTALSPQNVGIDQLLPAALREELDGDRRTRFPWRWRKRALDAPAAPSSERPSHRRRAQALGRIELILRSFDITQASLASYKIAGSPPDVLIEIPKTVCGSYEFHRAAELIVLGRYLAAKALDRYEEGAAGHSLA
ncbi:patatin-like phospholipase family protein [Halotalea alkalilenta]|uniref:Patatin n=1 Tax=Halotalea alkalilenta TaxID=376489 RepID=A0A172YFC4_9GAMM|nr:patatin-like phospholipase family protein [Halotalea alkalilenta]ANF57772.1 patatin [Halotalea alkalilenta]